MVLKKAARINEILQGEYVPGRDHDTVCNYRCPKCGNLTKISRNNHTIDYFGQLTPGVTCPHMCNFNDSLQLEDWVPVAKGSA